jgi:acyl-CoA thioesterase-1
MQAKYRIGLGLVSLVLAGCGQDGGSDSPAQGAGSAPAPASEQRQPSILVIGTSLAAGYGLDPALAWPAVLQRKIDSAGLDFRVINAGVSGETSAGALRRADWLLDRERPAVLILETGGNDGLRGIDPDTMRSNILGVLERARRQDPPPALVLFAMEAPPNLGARYTDRFRAAFADAARESDATLVPFFLDGVAGVDSLNLNDGIHPTARGHELAAANAWKVLEPVLRSRPSGR